MLRKPDWWGSVPDDSSCSTAASTYMSIQASLLAWNAQTVFLFFLHLVDIISQILLVVFSLDRNMHGHMAWRLLACCSSLPTCCSSTVVMGEKFCLGSWRLCHAQEMCCFEVTVPVFILPLWIVGGSLFRGLSPHIQASGGGWEWEQHAGSMRSPSTRWLLHALPFLSSSSLIVPSSLMPELLEQVNTVEKFHIFNPLLFRVSVLVECGSEKLLMSSTQNITFTSHSLILVCSLVMAAEK